MTLWTLYVSDTSLVGGEDNGGIIFADHQFCRDGAMAAARMLEFIVRNGSVQKQVDRLPKYTTIKAASYCDDDKKEMLIDRVAANHSTEKIDARTD